ncbi:MAG: SixA phosphatase family protein [Geminicoccaceae bacterium]|jgi:phosphohistidine phosphatase
MTDRTLVLLRHAKAAHPEGVADLDRALTPRGHADAAVAGGWLATKRLIPQVAMCSPSRRTRETWHGVALALGADSSGVTVVYDPALYEADRARSLLELVSTTDSAVSGLLLIGHNPTISMLSSLLDPSAPDEGLRTCGIAVHAVPGDWRDLKPGGAALTASATARA